MARLIFEMEAACLRAYHVRTPAELRWEWDQKPEPWTIPEVMRFVEGAMACGFVCSDYSMNALIETKTVDERPHEMIGGMGFPELRRYIHSVQRAEKWADGYSSPIIQSLASGALQLAAKRLEQDESLYEPW